MNQHFLYVLVSHTDTNPVVFYVGHTKDPKRRQAEHRSAARDPANTEYKYQWCRKLAAQGIDWTFEVVGPIEDDEDTEYEWILHFARHNQDQGITFIDNLPLTNMKAGDFLGEMLADRTIKSRDDIRNYKQQRAAALSVNYTRTKPTAQPTAKAQAIIDQTLLAAEQSRLQTLEQQRQRYAKELAHMKMLNDPERQRRIESETLRLMLLDRTIETRKHMLEHQSQGGYPDWTTLPDKTLNFKRK